MAPAAMVGYALLTTSRQVITTTTSTIAVMVAAVLGGLAVSGSAEYAAQAAGLAVIVGLLFILLGVLKLGDDNQARAERIMTSTNWPDLDFRNTPYRRPGMRRKEREEHKHRYRKNIHHRSIELERSVVHQLSNGVGQQRRPGTRLVP